MNMKKAVKKIVALTSGLTMIGATIMGATALDLGDYPSPFVQNGQFNGKIVVGANAATADVLGAIDISANLQAEAKTGVAIDGTAATTTVEGGVMIEDSNNQDLNYGDYFSQSTLDVQDFPELLADGTLEDDDGSDYDFEQEITVGNHTLLYSLVDNDVYNEPIMYVDLDAATNNLYTFTFAVEFDSGDEVDWDALDDSESIEMFGTVWTIDDIGSTEDIVLYGSDVTQLVTLNTPVDVDVDGETYTMNIVGANSDASPAEVHVSVNGEVKSLSEGDKKTINGLEVYVQDVFVSTVGGESASAKLFVGSKELNLGKESEFGSWVDVELDSEEMDGVEVKITGANDDAVSKIEFRITPTDIDNDDTNEDYDWLALGDTFVEPMFGFEFSFVEAIPDFMASSRDYVDIKSSNDDLEVTFTNADGVEYTFSPYKWDTSGTTNITNGEDFDLSIAAGDNIAKDTMFILEEDSSSSEPVSRIFEFTGADLSEDEATFKDIGSGQTLTVGNGDTLADTSVTVGIEADDVANISASANTDVYTASGALIAFAAIDGSPTLDITITEDEKGVNSDEVSGDAFTVAISYDSTDEEINVAKPASWLGGSDDDDDGDYFYGVSNYGTYYVQEADENTQLELWLPSEDTDYNVFVAGPDAVVSSMGGSEASTAYNVNPIGVGIGILDIEAPALGSVPMIVVGGPCANQVAAELMGMPANCVEGFEEGKAVIRFYESDNAVLVAGYSATDTTGAARVLADYEDWDLSGTEVEVVVPSLSSISVNPVA